MRNSWISEAKESGVLDCENYTVAATYLQRAHILYFLLSPRSAAAAVAELFLLALDAQVMHMRSAVNLRPVVFLRRLSLLFEFHTCCGIFRACEFG